MKKSIYTLTIIMLFAGALFNSCQSTSAKIKNAEEEVIDANEKVDDANLLLSIALQDSIVQFKKEAGDKISSYEKLIAEYKEKIAQQKKENKEKYEKALAELEQQNSDLKIELSEYKEESKDKWDIFKTEFNHDMDKLGAAFKEFTIKETK